MDSEARGKLPRPELVQELFQETGMQFYMYDADGFMREATTRLKLLTLARRAKHDSLPVETRLDDRALVAQALFRATQRQGQRRQRRDSSRLPSSTRLR